MKTFLIIPFLILVIFKAAAQIQTTKFSSINQVGAMSGSNGDSWMVQTINGIKTRKWFAGVGTGLDFYNDRTIPLFADLRIDLTDKINTPFVYSDAGINFAWLNSVKKQQKQFPTSSPALFYDVGIGWKLSGKNKRAFLFSAGYSLKQLKQQVKYLWWPAPTPQLESENYEHYNYLYRRVVIKIGFQL